MYKEEEEKKKTLTKNWNELKKKRWFVYKSFDKNVDSNCVREELWATRIPIVIGTYTNYLCFFYKYISFFHVFINANSISEIAICT